MINDEYISIRLMRDSIEDYILMSKWLTDTEVLKYYDGRDNPFNVERIMAKYRPRVLGNDNVVPCIIQYDNIDIGYIQYYVLTEDDKSEYGYESQEMIYGIDLFIGETSYRDRGIGTKALSLLIVMLEKEENLGRIIIDPQTWNVRAVRCYEKCGFKKVKLLPKHELHEGEYRDNWLMEIKL